MVGYRYCEVKAFRWWLFSWVPVRVDEQRLWLWVGNRMGRREKRAQLG